MKKNLIILFMVFQPCLLKAQGDDVHKKKFNLNIGIENQLPVSHFSRFYFYGFGGSVIAEHKIWKHLVLTLEPAYYHYFYYLRFVNIRGGTDYLALLTGVELNLPYKIYLLGKIGFARKKLPSVDDDAFGYSAGTGIGLFKKWEVQLRYMKILVVTSPPEVLSLRIGYNLKL